MSSHCLLCAYSSAFLVAHFLQFHLNPTLYHYHHQALGDINARHAPPGALDACLLDQLENSGERAEIAKGIFLMRHTEPLRVTIGVSNEVGTAACRPSPEKFCCSNLPRPLRTSVLCPCYLVYSSRLSSPTDQQKLTGAGQLREKQQRHNRLWETRIARCPRPRQRLCCCRSLGTCEPNEGNMEGDGRGWSGVIIRWRNAEDRGGCAHDVRWATAQTALRAPGGAGRQRPRSWRC